MNLHNSSLCAIILTPFFLALPYASSAADTGPCSANPENRQLDYWLGDWAVSNPGTPGGATSKVFPRLDQCLIVERWENGKGHSGENVFGYSADDKSWHGLFADNEGRVHVFIDGKVAAGSAEFIGPSLGPNGEAVLNRIRIVRINPNEVKQTWQKSTDKGATWTIVFGGQYSRKKP